ncbi:MAG TPA: hypothetical protein VMZ29_05270 [Candidatus Bathyarchaeia archaeon]|nr:hypothetical protein [Candidatus Bathyarchaeia archaeon]
MEDVIDQDRIEVDIDYGVSRTEHATERQAREKDDYISNEEIADNVKAAFNKVAKSLMFNQLDIGDRVIIKNADSNLNIVGAPLQAPNNVIMFKLITVMRHPNFRNVKDTKTIRITDKDIINESDLPFPEANIFNGAVWSDNEGDHIVLRINPDGTIYGSGDNFDFERDDKLAAAEQLEKWGYRYIGVD